MVVSRPLLSDLGLCLVTMRAHLLHLSAGRATIARDTSKLNNKPRKTLRLNDNDVSLGGSDEAVMDGAGHTCCDHRHRRAGFGSDDWRGLDAC